MYYFPEVGIVLKSKISFNIMIYYSILVYFKDYAYHIKIFRCISSNSVGVYDNPKFSNWSVIF